MKELIYSLQQAYLPDKKRKKSIPTVMKACFSEEKLIKQFGSPPPLSKRTPPFN